MANEDDYESEYEDSVDSTFNSQTNKNAQTARSAATLALWLALYIVFKKAPTNMFVKVPINQRARYQAHQTMENKDGPWSFSPEGFVESQIMTVIMDLLKDVTNVKDAINKTSDYIDKDSPIWKELEDILERQGQRMYHETVTQGQMESFMGTEVMVQWRTCEDNNNCATESPVCDLCEELSMEWFTLLDVPPAPHDWCRCNEPEYYIVPGHSGEISL